MSRCKSCGVDKEDIGKFTNDSFDLIKLGYDLSTYAAAIHWSDKETNTKEYLDKLKELIENYQNKYREFHNKILHEGEVVNLDGE